jgi:hypothetical protein
VFVSSDGVAAPDSAGRVQRFLAEACAALATPPAPTEVSVKNELAAVLWSSRVGLKVVAPSDVQALGQMLRDLGATNYDWARLDARAQFGAFQKYAAQYKLTAQLTEQIVKIATDRGLPVLAAVLILPCTDSAALEPPKLSDEQQALYEFWNDAARKHCAAQLATWEQSRDAYAKLIGNRVTPATLAEYDAFAEVHVDRGALAECKGDYWLHFLITPKLLCDEKRPKGCR